MLFGILFNGLLSMFGNGFVFVGMKVGGVIDNLVGMGFGGVVM